MGTGTRLQLGCGLLIVAALYFAFGKLGLLLAIPPGYATIAWPPSGIAVGALLLFGPRLWPGIFIGSLTLNASLGGVFAADMAIAWESLAVAAAIAAGSTGQALLARKLVEVAVGVPIELRRLSDIALLFALAGPLACLCAASVGTMALVASGAVDPAGAWNNWFTWWAGDVVGVVVFLPLTLVTPGVPGAMRYRGTEIRALPVASMLILLIPLGLTFYAWKATSQYIHDRNTTQFNRLAEANESALLHRLNSYEQALVGGLGFFGGSDNVTREEWQAFVDAQDLSGHFAGINGIGYIASVPQSKLADYVAAIRASEPGFAIHPATTDRPNYIIQFIEPIDDNREALGLNIGFEDNRVEAAELSRDAGAPAITRRILLVQDQTKSPGFLLLHPRYEKGKPLDTVAQRRAALMGWVYAPFVGRSFMRELTPSQGTLHHLRVYDGDEASPDHLIYASDDLTDSPAASAGTFEVEKHSDVMQQRWTMVWTSTPEFDRTVASNEPWLILIGGLTFTALFGALLVFFARRAETVSKLVSAKTREIAASEEQLKLLIRHTPAAVAMFDRDMRYIMTSERWITDYGLAECDIVGKTQYEVFPEHMGSPRWEEIYRRALAGETISEDEDLWVRAERLPEWVKWAIHPWENAASEIGGIVMFTEVISDRKRAESRDQILHEIAIDAVDASSVDEILSGAVQKLCTHFSWLVGHVLIWDPKAGVLASNGNWRFGPSADTFDAFRAAREKISFAPGIGIVGQTLAERRPVYDDGFDEAMRPGHAEAAVASPLNCTLSIPVFVGPEPVAILELFANDRPAPTPGALKFLDLLCIQLSRIVERRRFEEALAKSNSLNNAVLNSADYLVIATDRDGQVLVFNRAAERKTGYVADEVIGAMTPPDWHDAGELERRARELGAELTEDISPGFASLVRRAEISGMDSGEWTIVRKDGTRFPAFTTVTPLRDETDSITGFVIILVDVTLRKLQDAELRASQEAFGTAMENASTGMALIGVDGNWVKVNPALCALLGYDEAELCGTHFDEVTHREDRGMSDDLQRELLNGERRSYEIEKRYVHKSGRTVWADVKISMAHGANRAPKWFIVQVQDASDRREMERLKSEFVSVVSHELRTPLTSIRGALGLLAGTMADKMPPQANQLIAIALKNCERLIPLINDILDMDKIASGNMRFEFKHEPLVEAVTHAIEANRAYAERFGVAFRLEAAEPDLTVNVDSARLAQVLANLLSNAAKFSPENGEVVVKVEVDGRRARVSVRDFGNGIPQEFRDRIFTKFSQADSSVTREKGGTGLGLHISKQLIERMDGSIDFDSVAGEGATFWIELPVVKAEGGEIASTDTAIPAPQHLDTDGGPLPCVLHVEDDDDLCDMLRAALGNKVRYLTVRTLGDARRMLSTSAFDLVLIDIGLPDGIGLALIRDLAQSMNAKTPVIVLSAYETPPSVDVSATLVKSQVSEREIVAAILKHIGPATPMKQGASVAR